MQAAGVIVLSADCTADQGSLSPPSLPCALMQRKDRKPFHPRAQETTSSLISFSTCRFCYLAKQSGGSGTKALINIGKLNQIWEWTMIVSISKVFKHFTAHANYCSPCHSQAQSRVKDLIWAGPQQGAILSQSISPAYIQVFLFQLLSVPGNFPRYNKLTNVRAVDNNSWLFKCLLSLLTKIRASFIRQQNVTSAATSSTTNPQWLSREPMVR